MIEVLVAGLILGVGLLGILSLQNRSIQFNQQAYYNSQAMALAMDIAERMRANNIAIEEYRVNFGSPVMAGNDCEANSCTADELASWDLSQWKESVEQILPSGDAEIVSINPGGDPETYSITIEFNGNRNFSGPGEAKERVVYRVEDL